MYYNKKKLLLLLLLWRGQISESSGTWNVAEVSSNLLHV